MIASLGLALPAASAHAHAVDRLTLAFAALVLLLSVPVFLAIFGFAVRYRRGREVNRSHAPDRNVWLEVSWSVIPFLLILGFFVVSTAMYAALRRPPPNALAIDVVARQWMWKFQHPGGQAEINGLHVPTGQPVVLTMTSQDVIHSLYVPALRIKQDVLPGRYTRLWFSADRPGTYHLFCAQFCGTDHAVMGGGFTALAPDAYGRWLDTQASGGALAVQGGNLYRRLGCGTCHARAEIAPPLAGLAGSQVRLADGRSVLADDDYLRRAILSPETTRVAGFRPIMPRYGPLIVEEDAMKLIAYLRNLRAEPGRAG